MDQVLLSRRDVIPRPFASGTATVGDFDNIFSAIWAILGNPGATVNKRMKNQ